MENTFKLGPDKVFRTCDVEKATEEVLKENLKDVEYNSTKCRELSQDVASKIMFENLTLVKLSVFLFHKHRLPNCIPGFSFKLPMLTTAITLYKKRANNSKEQKSSRISSRF
jgi:hypothetical protein